jgi:hypothetical protein
MLKVIILSYYTFTLFIALIFNEQSTNNTQTS